MSCWMVRCFPYILWPVALGHSEILSLVWCSNKPWSIFNMCGRVQNYLFGFLMPPVLRMWVSKSIALCRFPSLKCWELGACTTETVGTGAQLLRGSCVGVRLSLPQGISRELSVAPLRSAGAQVALAVYGSSHLRLKLIVPSKLPFGLNSEQKEVNKTQCTLSQPYLPHW